MRCWTLLLLGFSLCFGCGQKNSTTAVPAVVEDVDCVAEVNREAAKAAPAEQNAVVRLLEVIGPNPGGKELPPEYLNWLGVELPVEKGDRWQSAEAFFPKEWEADKDGLRAGLRQRESRPWKAKDHPQHAEWLTSNAKAFDRLTLAAESPTYYQPVVPARLKGGTDSLLSSPLPIVTPAREMAFAMVSRAMLHAGEGRVEEAWGDVRTVYQLGLLFTRGLTVLEYIVGQSLVRSATEAGQQLLALGNPTTSAAAGRFRELIAAEIPTPASHMEHWKVTCRDVVQHFRQYGHAYLDWLSNDGGEDAMPSTPRADERKKLDVLDWAVVLKPSADNADALARAFKLATFAQRQQAIEEVDLLVAKRKHQLRDGLEYEKADGLSERCGTLLLGLLTPASRNLNRAHGEAEQRHRNLLVAFALAAHHADTGRYPERLSDLAPNYLKDIPCDLFSEKPLVYARTEDSYGFYSVGVNGEDDGGEGDDVAVRMPRAKK